MSKISALQKAIYGNLQTLRDLYNQAEGLKGAIEEITDETAKEKILKTYEMVVKTLEDRVETTDTLIQELKSLSRVTLCQ